MRFTRIYHGPKDDPGSRIRVEHDPDDTDEFCVCDENTLPEKVLDPDARHVTSIGCVNLDRTSARWLRDTLVELCASLDADGTPPAADLDRAAVAISGRPGRPAAELTAQLKPATASIGPADTVVIVEALELWDRYLTAPHADIARIRAALTGTVLS